MTDVDQVLRIDPNTHTLNTGSPHYVAFRDELEDMDVFVEGRAIRNSPPFADRGINVNFVSRDGDGEISIRTYERGVEDETYACGTGVVAAAIASAYSQKDTGLSWLVHAKGGDLRVNFTRNDEARFKDVTLTGPAVEVFRGEIPGPLNHS
jgi:diaminopimelate epimerase